MKLRERVFFFALPGGEERRCSSCGNSLREVIASPSIFICPNCGAAYGHGLNQPVASKMVGEDFPAPCPETWRNQRKALKLFAKFCPDYQGEEKDFLIEACIAAIKESKFRELEKVASLLNAIKDE